MKEIIEQNYYNRLLNIREQKDLFEKMINELGFDIVYEDDNKNIIIANELKEWE